MVHQVNKLRKAGGAYVTHDELAEILKPYADALSALEEAAVDHEEKITRIEGALEIDDLNAVIDELGGEPLEVEIDGEGALPDAVEGEAEERTAPPVGPNDETEKGRHPAESDPEGHELVADIHKRKASSRKRKPEGQDPLGLVPDTEED